jgi:hypothetical protein
MARAPRAPVDLADEVDEIVEEVAQWAVDSIEHALDQILGSGRPIGSPKKSEREQVVEYMKIKGNPDAWRQWMAETDADLRDRMGVVFEAMQVPPEFIAAIHPFDIVVREAVAYSRRMERLLAEYEGKTQQRMAIESGVAPHEQVVSA